VALYSGNIANKQGIEILIDAARLLAHRSDIAFVICGALPDLATAFYHSAVNFTTLGYGDIVPRTDVARGLTIVEGVGGQLFLAVMVARLVSLYAQGQPRTRL